MVRAGLGAGERDIATSGTGLAVRELLEEAPGRRVRAGRQGEAGVEDTGEVEMAAEGNAGISSGGRTLKRSEHQAWRRMSFMVMRRLGSLVRRRKRRS